MQNIEALCPPDAAYIIEKLNSAGYSAYAVGGCVRDTLLGILPHDWDITTSALPEAVLEVFKDAHTIPTGLKHGTITVMMHHEPYEITTFRIDGAYSDSRHPESVTFSDRISDDLSRRDFTINALAWNRHSGVVDCFSGIEDLKKGVIRAVGDPKTRFEEDALRILRGYRFAAQLGFSIEEETRNALRSEAYRLKNISRERISSEFCRLVAAKGALSVLKMLESDGIFPYILDGAAYQLPDPSVLDRIEEVPAAAEDRIAFLIRGYAPEAIAGWLHGLRLSNRQHKDIVTLTDPDGYASAAATPYDARRMLAAYGTLSERVLTVAALHGVKDTEEKRAEIRTALENGDCVAIASLAISGKDLIREGIAKGAEIGRVLSALLDAVLHDPTQNTPESLMKIARETAKTV